MSEAWRTPQITDAPRESPEQQHRIDDGELSWEHITAGTTGTADTPLRFPGQYYYVETGLNRCPAPRTITPSTGDSMTTWLDTLDEPHGIRAIYGDEVPALKHISLHEVCLHRDGPRAVLRFDLPQFPQDPPKKWSAQGFNTVQLTLMLVDVQELSMDGWSNESVVDLSLERSGEFISATTTAGPTTLRITARAATLTSISAYQNEEQR